MSAAYQLLQENARHAELLNQLETQYPNITKVDRDPDGAIKIDDFPVDLNQFWNDIDSYLKKLK
jgi:hypothetical protein